MVFLITIKLPNNKNGCPIEQPFLIEAYFSISDEYRPATSV